MGSAHHAIRGIGSDGTYSVSVEPGSYYVLAYPPTSITDLDRGTSAPLTVASSTTSTGNVVLDVTQPLPSNITMTYNTGQFLGSVPVENWENPFTITAQGCPNGTATWQIQGYNTQTAMYQTVTGPMTETPAGSGNYTGTVPSLYPMHGPIVITVTINCPGGSTQTTTFNAYIDPSGTVVNQFGTPISGATVTLYNSSSLSGPWTQVPNADTAIMSPSNTANPSVTGPVGQYGWDVVAGYYQLQASAPGCSTVTSPALTIPPPVVDLTLTLNCTIQGPTWTGSPGGVIKAKSTKITLQDTSTGTSLNCKSSVASGTLQAGSGLSGTGIGSVTALNFSNCTGPAGLTFNMTASASDSNPWPLNANSYKATTGVTTGTITTVDATVTGSGCTATVVGPDTTSPGQVQATYTNKSHQLKVTSDGGILHIWNVAGCLGLINGGDTATFTGTYTVSPAQTITNP